jgi:arylsulfatase A-like enzyme
MISLAALLFVVMPEPSRPREVPARPNVLVLVADDLGIDRVRAYGFQNQQGNLIAPLTSRIDQLAAQGVLFRSAWAAPACSPARACALTGRYPNRTGVGQAIDLPGETGLRDDELTIADLLPPEYGTAVVGKWHLAGRGPLGALTQGLDHAPRCGFDLHCGTFANFYGSQSYFDWALLLSKATNLAETGEFWVHGEYATTRTTDIALRTIRTFGERPWFLWVAYNAPHKPYHVPPAHLIQSPNLNLQTELGRGKAMIEALDAEIGRLLDGIPAAIRARTTVVFLGDNGTAKPLVQAPFPPLKAKGTVYNGGVHVPLIVAGAGIRPEQQGSECAALVDISDLLPTVAELCGAPLPPQADGHSLVPYFSDPAAPSQRTWIYAERFGPNFVPEPGRTLGDAGLLFHDQTARDARYKLVRKWSSAGGPQGSEVLEFYDLEADYFETADLLDILGLPPPPLQSAFDALREVAARMAR